ncbi:MAG: fibronectin type III domain-containing protein [Nevskia sp.]|nr:fibronectin type III domain-containing protein [Nevskia sp.]
MTGLAATPGIGQISLSWTAVPGATGYIVSQGTTLGSEKPIATHVTGTDYTATGLTNRSMYYFTVTATNQRGSGLASAEVSATPGLVSIIEYILIELFGPTAPTGVTATPGNGQVTLSWSADVDAVSYTVYEGTAAGAGPSTVVQSAVTGTGATITGLTNGRTYYFDIRGKSRFVYGPVSKVVSATPVAPAG